MNNKSRKPVNEEQAQGRTKRESSAILDNVTCKMFMKDPAGLYISKVQAEEHIKKIGTGIPYDIPEDDLRVLQEISGKSTADLSKNQQRILEFYQVNARKFGVSISIIKDTSLEQLMSAQTSEDAAKIIEDSTSKITVYFPFHKNDQNRG